MRVPYVRHLARLVYIKHDRPIREPVRRRPSRVDVSGKTRNDAISLRSENWPNLRYARAVKPTTEHVLRTPPIERRRRG